MMLFTKESLNEFLSLQSAPCLSLYQPTHRSHPENQQDLIRFHNLVKDLKHSLREKYSIKDTSLFLKPFEDLVNDGDFWNHTLDGLCILAGINSFRTFRLPRPVPELAIVADSFHTKPLKRYLQSVHRYHILTVDLEKIQLFEGYGDTLDKIDLIPEVPRTIADALGEELTDKHLTFASYNGKAGTNNSMVHGHGGRKEESKVDAERFFRIVDRAILEHYSHPSSLNLILAALPEHQSLFRKISHNSYLMPEGIAQDPSCLSMNELRELTWQIIGPKYKDQLITQGQGFKMALSKGLGSSNLEEVAQAAVAGKVETLIIEDQRQIAGRIDETTGLIQYKDLINPEIDDLFDDLSELVEKKSGKVMVVPSQFMPSETGLAAIYRY